jgi:hypothetical protein
MEKEPEISLNVIMGTPTPRTIRLLGFLKNHKVIVLIDSGSTHNVTCTVEMMSLC